MKKTIKTEKIYMASLTLNAAKYGKLSDDDKIKVWKISRKLQPIAKDFEDATKDATEKMKPEGYDDKLQKSQEYERMTKASNFDARELPMGPAEHEAFLKENRELQKLVTDALQELSDKEVELEFDALSQDSFVKLINSNDWTFGQVTLLGEVIVED